MDGLSGFGWEARPIGDPDSSLGLFSLDVREGIKEIVGTDAEVNVLVSGGEPAIRMAVTTIFSVVNNVRTVEECLRREQSILYNFQVQMK